jgi:hypothetical protein
MRLRLDERRERLILTYPRRVSQRTALDWAGKQADWVEARIAEVRPAEPFQPGATIPFQGKAVRLTWREGLPRGPRLAGDMLSCGGPPESFAARIERFLKAEARYRLSEETADMANRAGVSVKSVAIGDASSRWGSCSASGAIRYNWRIILAPPHLLSWLVAHEVSHRVHMDHGPAFKALEARLYGGDVRAARAELRTLGPRLKRVGGAL